MTLVKGDSRKEGERKGERKLQRERGGLTFQPMVEIEGLTAPSDHAAAMEEYHCWDLGLSLREGGGFVEIELEA